MGFACVILAVYYLFNLSIIFCAAPLIRPLGGHYLLTAALLRDPDRDNMISLQSW